MQSQSKPHVLTYSGPSWLALALPDQSLSARCALALLVIPHACMGYLYCMAMDMEKLNLNLSDVGVGAGVGVGSSDLGAQCATLRARRGAVRRGAASGEGPSHEARRGAPRSPSLPPSFPPLYSHSTLGLSPKDPSG